MAIEDDGVVDAEFLEGNRASKSGRSRANYCDLVEARLFRDLITPPNCAVIARASFHPQLFPTALVRRGVSILSLLARPAVSTLTVQGREVGCVIRDRAFTTGARPYWLHVQADSTAAAPPSEPVAATVETSVAGCSPRHKVVERTE